jgi:hypothetical protein
LPISIILKIKKSYRKKYAKLSRYYFFRFNPGSPMNTHTENLTSFKNLALIL